MQPEFTWRQWPDAEALLEEQVDLFLERHGEAKELADAMERVASTRMLDWLDSITFSDTPEIRTRLAATGFEHKITPSPSGQTVFHHPGAQLPRIIIDSLMTSIEPSAVGIKVDSIEDFLMTRGQTATIQGTAFAPLRVAHVWTQESQTVQLIERRGDRSFVPREMSNGYVAAYVRCREKWATRQRMTLDETTGMATSFELAEEIIAEVGRDQAAWIVFEVERAYWQGRNWAGQMQKARQDRLGLGWANHDHHTFRSSRVMFLRLIALFELLGFATRERFYAGEEAGWGAQVLEQPQCGLVVFADVDLLPGEVAVDFAHQQLTNESTLGTVGMWCALHGESILGAGMHHLEAQFEFDRLRADLELVGVGMMKPFSDMPHLRQAFTKGERWFVDPSRLQRLQNAGSITVQQCEKFSRDGAIGSHLENLQRRDGFKGFNQHNVSSIIKATDPRHQNSTS